MYSTVLICALLAQGICAVTIHITQQVQITQTVYRPKVSATATTDAGVDTDYGLATTPQQSQAVEDAPDQLTTPEAPYSTTTAAISAVDLAATTPRVILMGTITLTAGGLAQTMSSKQYSLDDCHLFVGTTKVTLCSSINAAQATPAVASVTRSEVAWPDQLASSSVNSNGSMARAGAWVETTRGPYVLGTGSPRLRSTGYVASSGASVATSRFSTATSRTRLPWSSSGTPSASMTSADQTASATQSGSSIADGSACRDARPVSVLFLSAAAAALNWYWWF